MREFVKLAQHFCGFGTQKRTSREFIKKAEFVNAESFADALKDPSTSSGTGNGGGGNTGGSNPPSGGDNPGEGD